MSKRGWLFSGLLHVGVIVAAVLGLPQVFESDALVPSDQPIVVSVVEFAEESTAPAEEAKPEPEPEPIPELRRNPNRSPRWSRRARAGACAGTGARGLRRVGSGAGHRAGAGADCGAEHRRRRPSPS